MLQVRDVQASSGWYQRVIGLHGGHGGDEFEMLLDGAACVLQLHRLDAHEHRILQPADASVLGAGTPLWFEAADRDAFAALVDNARAAGATVAQEPGWNPLARHYEATLIDTDGYVVVPHSPFEPGH